MINRVIIKIFSFKFLFFISLLTLSYSETLKSIQNSLLKQEALKYGFDLTNPDDNFFLDICIQFAYNDKDLTLEYKQKYFFFPKNSYENIIFRSPKRNNFLSCFLDAFEFKFLFYNMSFLIQFPLLIIELILLLFVIILDPKKIFYNSSYRQLEIIKKGKNIQSSNKNDKNNFSEFIAENDIYNETNQKIIVEEEKYDIEKNYNVKINQIAQQNNDEKANDEDNKNSINSKKNFGDNDDDKENNNIESNKEEINNNSNRKEDNIENNLNINKESKFAQQINYFKSDHSVGNLDNYTFGNDKQINFKGKEEINNSKDQKNENENKENIQKRMEQFYNLVNQKKFKDNKNNNIINNEHNSNKKLKEDIRYSREEFFYFGYPLARIQDKRNIFQMYYDLLNQCQILFKFCCIPFNIYENRILQIIYYLFKFNLYFLFNIILTGNNVINKIYDDKNTYKDDIYRSFLSCFFTYLIGLFIYHLTNIKKALLKRKYKLLNLRITEQRMISEFSKMTYIFCMDYFINKLVILFIILVCFSLAILYICISFCFVYHNTQMHILKCILYSCVISQLSPFIFCWIPACLRKLSLYKKILNLYLLAKFVESFFVP